MLAKAIRWTMFFATILVTFVCMADSTDRVCRSSTVKHQFDKLHGFPHGREGYVVDHVCALANGGLDTVQNMQYQTIAEGHIKDRIENTLAGRVFCDDKNSLPYRTVFNCK